MHYEAWARVEGVQGNELGRKGLCEGMSWGPDAYSEFISSTAPCIRMIVDMRKAIQCPACGYRRSQMGKIKQHILATNDEVHGPHADSLTRCRVCWKKFKSPQGRIQHEQFFPCTAERFHQLEQSSPPAARFLTFLCILDTRDIPEILFCRMWTTRACWSCDGEVEYLTIPMADPVVDLLTDPIQFNEIIQLLESSRLLKSESGILGKRRFSVDTALRDRITKTVPYLAELEWLRLVLVCHTFPGTCEEFSFEDTGRALLPQVRHALKHCYWLREKILRDPSAGYGIVLTLLLSSKFSHRSWKQYTVELAEKILSDRPQFGKPGTLYLQKLIKQRSRDISRRIPGISINSLCEEQPPTDPRTNALHGEHLRSNAQDLIMEHDHAGALKVLEQFFYFHTFPTTIEKKEKAHHLFIQGKICRWDALFSEASNIFYKVLLSRPSQFDETGCSLTGHLVGALCEQRDLDSAETIARQAVKSCTELDQWGAKRQGLRLFRNLQLSVAETLVCQALVERIDGGKNSEKIDQKLKEAGTMYRRLRGEFESIKSRGEGSWSSEFSSLRVFFGRALIPHLAGRFIEARDRWEEARKLTESLILEEKVTRFTPMIIDYSICDIDIKTGEFSEAEILLERAKNCFREVGREYWWTGLGTFWLDFLKASISESGIQ